MGCDRTYREQPRGGYRKPVLDGLFDDRTPPLQVRRWPHVPGPKPGAIVKRARKHDDEKGGGS
jgi:hypothetical protein